MSKHRSHSRAHTHFAGHVCPKQLSTVFTRVRFVVAQTVDPRDFEINGLVKRFKRIYKFVEQSLDAVPLVASPMRQILAEAFNVSNDYLREVEEQYAALAMLPSASFDEPQPTTIKHLETDVEMKVLTATGVSIVENEVEEAEVEPPLVFEKDDMVEILHSELWTSPSGFVSVHYATFYASHKKSPPALYEYAAEAWRTAASWILEPFSWL
ncbi:unnamed protein product [Peronospora destructor]|uniref:Uncharacterized protein n=1 Tax=Peronospora destructor TaxID=86335 RepID=A0AAV0TZC7_9STRA|nr:unnamed protein product [Peronospora destructor]